MSHIVWAAQMTSSQSTMIIRDLRRRTSSEENHETMSADAQGFFANPASWLSVAAILVAAVTALFQIRSSQAARRQAWLAAQAAEAAGAPPEVYVIDSYWKKASAAGHRVYALYVRVTNPAPSANTLLSADLRVRFRSAASESTVPLPHTTGSTALTPRWGSTPLEFPAVIAARGAVLGHLVFDDTGLVPPMAQVESYQLVLRDVASAETVVDIYILMEALEVAPNEETAR